MKNQVILLANRPLGIPKESDFEFRDIEMPILNHGQVLIKILWLGKQWRF